MLAACQTAPTLTCAPSGRFTVRNENRRLQLYPTIAGVRRFSPVGEKICFDLLGSGNLPPDRGAALNLLNKPPIAISERASAAIGDANVPIGGC